MAGFFFNDTATTEIYTLSLHDALPIWTRAQETELASEVVLRTIEPANDYRMGAGASRRLAGRSRRTLTLDLAAVLSVNERSEEHTSELQSRQHLVCRLLLEKTTLSSAS